MNSIARAISLEVIKTYKKSSQFWRVTKKSLLVSLLTLCLFASAFAIVYMKDLNRRLFIQYQGLQRESTQATIEWGKLLLEQSTWSTQSRVQQMAQGQLGMIVPPAPNTVLVKVHEHETVR